MPLSSHILPDKIGSLGHRLLHKFLCNFFPHSRLFCKIINLGDLGAIQDVCGEVTLSTFLRNICLISCITASAFYLWLRIKNILWYFSWSFSGGGSQIITENFLINPFWLITHITQLPSFWTSWNARLACKLKNTLVFLILSISNSFCVVLHFARCSAACNTVAMHPILV